MKNTRGIYILKIAFIAAGVIFALYGIAVLCIMGFGSKFCFAFLIGGIALTVMGTLLTKILSWNKRVLCAICIALILCLCNFGIYEAKAISMAYAGETLKTSAEAFGGVAPEWIIVLGAKVNADGEPMLEYRARLERAYELCTEESTLILSGGKGADEPVSEAQCGLNWLSKRTPDSGHIGKEIIPEEKSTTTTENLKFSLEIMKAHGGSADDRVLVISSAFHLYRASVIAERVGFRNCSFAGSTGFSFLIPYYYVREYAAYVWESL